MICDVNCYTYKSPAPGNVIAILFGSGLLFNQLFHQLLFLNKESPYNSIPDTVCATRPTVGTLYCLLVLGKTHVFFGTKGGDLVVRINSKYTRKSKNSTTLIASHKRMETRDGKRSNDKRRRRMRRSYPGECNATVTTSRAFAWFFDVQVS